MSAIVPASPLKIVFISCWIWPVFGVALVNCIWFNLWIVRTSRHYYALHVSSSYISARSLLWTQLMHKAATVTFDNTHIARTINTTCQLMKTKRKRRKIPSSVQSAYITNESLNSRCWTYTHWHIAEFKMASRRRKSCFLTIFLS